MQQTLMDKLQPLYFLLDSKAKYVAKTTLNFYFTSLQSSNNLID